MELLAEYKGDCDGLFLKLNKDAQESIPYDEKDQGYKAYWRTDDESPDGDDDDNENSSEEGPVIINYTITGLQGTDESITRSRLFEGYGTKLFFAWSDGGWLWIKDGSSEAAAIIGGDAPWNASGIPQSGLLQIGGVTVSRILPDGSMSPPKDTGNPNDPPKPKVIVKRIKEDKTEETIATIPRPTKPTEAVFICEDCEINCVLLIRKKTDKFAVGICICNKEEDWILTKAQVKAELLQELPSIIQQRIKSQDLPTLQTEVSTTVREGFETDVNAAKSQIATDIKGDEAFVASLKSQIQADILSDLDFLGSISERVKQEIQLAEFKTPYFEFLDGNKIADIIIASLGDATKLESLKTKLGITASPPPNNSTGTANKLTANGYEWTIGKDMGGVEVVSVSRTAQTGDNLSTLTNSGSAIVTALSQKFPGKNFSVTSSNQMMGTYSYSIDQY